MYKYIGVIVAVFALTTWAQASDDVSVRLFNAQESLAARGDAQAQYYLAEMYEQGLGTAANPQQALEWYRKAAAQGHAMSQRKLKEFTASPATPAKPKPASAPAPTAAQEAVQAQPPPQPASVAPVHPAPTSTDDAQAAKDAARKQAEQARMAKLHAEQQANARRAKEAAAAADKEKRRGAAKAALSREKSNAKKYGTGY